MKVNKKNKKNDENKHIQSLNFCATGNIQRLHRGSLYKCKYCDHTFYSENANTKHENNHKTYEEEGELIDSKDGEIL